MFQLLTNDSLLYLPALRSQSVINLFLYLQWVKSSALPILIITDKRCYSLVNSFACCFLVKTNNVFDVLVVNCENGLFLIVFVISRYPQLRHLQLLERHTLVSRIEKSQMTSIAVDVTLLPSKKSFVFS